MTNEIAFVVTSKVDENTIFNSNDHIFIFGEVETSLSLIMANNRSVSIAAFEKSKGLLTILKKLSYFSDKMKFLYESYGLVVYLNSENKLCIASSNNLSQTNILDKANLVDAVVFPFLESRKLKCLSMDTNGNLCFYVIDEIGHIIDRFEFECVSLDSKLLIRGNYFVVLDRSRCIVLIDEDFPNTNSDYPYHIVKIEKQIDHIDILNYDKAKKSLKAIFFTHNESKSSIYTYESLTDVTVESFTFIEPAFSSCIYDFGKYLCLFGNNI